MSRPNTARHPATAATPVALLLAIALIGSALLATGCSSSDAAVDLESSTTAPQPMAVEELVTSIVDTYGDAMQELVALLEDKPDAETALPQVQALREEYIQKMVALGHQRELLDESEKEQANSLQWSALMATADEPWYEEYDSLFWHYHEADLELANLIATFNTLTQYSAFELLRDQSPDEAERLGITEPQ